MDNSFGPQPPWGPRGSAQSTGQTFDPRLAQMMGASGYPSVNGVRPSPTASFGGNGGFPIWDLDIQSQMFMRAMNFEKMMASQQSSGMRDSAIGSGSGDMASAKASSNDEDLHQSVNRADTSMDLLEQQQAVEQARLLHRFKELRNWQQQQQEMLIAQQQQQLNLLRNEQHRVQSALTKQREQQWGGGRPNTIQGMATPPRSQLPAGTNLMQMLAAGTLPQMNAQPSLGKGSLPKPVIYVAEKEEDDEIKTNPDLFSDTNSNVDSQATNDDGIFPIPESASEASVDVRPSSQKHKTMFDANISLGQAPQIVRHQPVNLSQQSWLDRDIALKSSMRSATETDEGFATQSFQSPTFMNAQRRLGGSDFSSDYGEEEQRRGVAEESPERDEDDEEEEDEDEDDSEEESEEGSSEEEEEQDTQIEVKQADDFDEKPIKPGVDGKKTFEQLLEEQLRAEEERLKKASENTESPSQPKKTFLKKGQGIARFEGKSEHKSRKPKKNSQKTASSTVQTAISQKPSGDTNSSSKSSSKPSMAASKGSSGQAVSSKQATGQAGVGNKQNNTNQSCQPSQIKPSKTAELKLKKPTSRSPVSAQILASKARQERQLQETGNMKMKSTSETEKPVFKMPALPPEAMPDDASFVANLKERQKESEKDLEELDEFEMLEEFADNMSFCSNSSLVTKGIKGLPRDRILAGMLPKKQTSSAVFTRRSEPENPGKQQENSLKTVPERTSCDDKQEQSSEEESSDEDSDDSEDEDEEEGDEDENFVKSISVQAKVTSNEIPLPEKLLQPSGKYSQSVSLNNNASKEIQKRSSEGERDSEEESDAITDDSDSEEEEEEDKYENRSPSKVMTRKVAGRDDRAMLNVDAHALLQKLNLNSAQSADFLTASLNSSSFAPKAKSPIVISREIVPNSKKLTLRPDLQEDVQFLYHSDTDSTGKKLKDSLSDEDLNSEKDESEQKTSKNSKNFTERKTLQFDDEDEWEDLTPHPTKTQQRVIRSEKTEQISGKGDATTRPVNQQVKPDDQYSAEQDQEDTPPTSKLVSKLFPKLRTQQNKQQQQDQQKIQTASEMTLGDGAQSKVLRDKLMELEREIEKFRNENTHLARLRTEREEGLSKLKKEIAEFEKEKSEELKRLEEFKSEEMKKLKHERKMFDKYQKAVRAGPDKKEREEIETLKTQITDLQEEMKRKESRWTSNNSRLRATIEQLQDENKELKEEIRLLEKKRLEWMQKDQANKPKHQKKWPGLLPARSSTPTGEEEEGEGDNNSANNNKGQHPAAMMHDGIHDISSASTIKSSMSLRPSQQQPKVNVRSSIPPNTRAPSHQAQTVHQRKDVVHQSVTSTNNKSSVPANHRQYQAKQNPAQAGFNPNKPVQKAGPHSAPGVKPGNQSVQSSKNSVLRNSLTEDIPRRNLDTIAEPQDVSVYSETDGEVSMQAPTNLPRKLASKQGADHLIIDKGDNGYEETQHADGKVERLYNNGAREILFSNGTRKEISADSMSIVVSFFNGDMKQIMPDQRVVYFYADAQTTHTSYPDGLEILQFPNNQIEKLYADGTKEITFTDQTVKYIFPNGTEESIFQDGTVIRLEKNGDKTMEFPNGQREIHTQDYKKREYPDGTVKTVYPDGRQETRYSNGRLRVKDKDGNVIIDRHC